MEWPPNGPQITNQRWFRLALVGGPSENLMELDSLLLPNFLIQGYTPLSARLQLALYVPPLQQLLTTILDQLAQPTHAIVSGNLYMVISLEGYENVNSSAVFFDKAKGGKIVLPLPITCLSDRSVMLIVYNTKTMDP
jgi:hypothetical protein